MDVFRCSFLRRVAVVVAAAVAWSATVEEATAQAIVYTAMRPAVPYVANYVPAGNYAAVTAFSPPVVDGVPVVAGYAPSVTPVVATVPSSSIAVTSYYVPPPIASAAAPVTAYYAPTPVAATAVPVTAYYAPTAVAAPVAPAVVPVAAYYPPTVVARRGLFGATRYRYYPGAWYTPY